MITAIHTNLRVLRAKLGISKAEMSRRYGVEQARYSKWEDNIEPPLHMIIKIADYHKITTDYLLKDHQ